MIPSYTAIDLGTGSLNIESIHGSYRFTCVLFVNSAIKCFGDNEFAQLGTGSTTRIGDNSDEMGKNLRFIKLFSPTRSPSKLPTKKPSKTPTISPTLKPSPLSLSPTNSPNRKPSKSPLLIHNPSANPSNTPTSNPTTKVPTKAPTLNPTESSTSSFESYLSLKADCYQYTDKTACATETNAECGTCAYYNDKILYGFKVRVSFVMEKGVRFIDFDNVNANPPKTAFKDAVKAVIKSQLNGQDKITINRIGQIYQTTGAESGWADFEFYFIDSESNRAKTKEFLISKPDAYDYIDDLNLELNKKMKTTGKKYITGRINISNLNIIDLAQGKGACGCNKDTASSATKMELSAAMMIAASIFIPLFLH